MRSSRQGPQKRLALRRPARVGPAPGGKTTMRVEISSRQAVLRCPAPAIRAVLRKALQMEGTDAELSVALVGDAEMEALNRRFLGRKGVTDVLAFPYGTQGGLVSGEIVVNAELARREAAARSHTPLDELMLYLVHGLLHLLGYDDHKPAERREMHERERSILAAAGHVVES